MIKDREHQLQCGCVNWFRFQYPQLKERLFAVPNGGQRNLIVASKLKAEGVLAGVADLILLVKTKKYGALLIEMKAPKGKQSISQKQWEMHLTKDQEYKYVICYSFEEFKSAIEEYLKN